MQTTILKQKSNYWRVFALCFFTAVLLFAPHCIVDAVAGGGYFHYAGDFNDQQINFYQYANAFVKNGGSFSWATDLGSGFVNSYSFYLLGSPFFWLSMVVPARLMPWAMVPLLCLKMAVAGGGGYLWARRWVRDETWSMLTGCLYAFSGFSIYNIFFNHFLDVVALFPYMLAALDDAVIDDKKGAFPFWVALNLVDNYFFFAGQAVFLIIYFFCMAAGRQYELGLRKFVRLAWETALGCACGCVLLLPAGLSLLQNPRTIDPFSGYGYLFYGKSQQYGAIFYSTLLMPDAPYFKDLFQEGILKHTSLTAYLPLVGVAGGLAFCRARERHPFTYVLKVCVACAFVPVLNSAFYALNSSYYARWYYMPILVLCGATCYLLSRPALAEQRLPRALRLTTFLTLTAVVFAVVPGKDDDGNTVFGVLDEPARFWAIFGMTMLGIVIFALLWHFCRRKRRWGAILTAAVLGFSLLYGSLHLSLTKYAQWDVDSNLIAETYDSIEDVAAALPDDAFYRIDAYGAHNNLGLPAILQLDGCAEYHGVLPRGRRQAGCELQAGRRELRPARPVERAVHAGRQGQGDRVDRQGSARLAAHRRDRRLRPLRERKLGADGLYLRLLRDSGPAGAGKRGRTRPDFVPRDFAGRRPDLRLRQPAGTLARRGADRPRRGRLRRRLCRPPCRRCGSVYRDGHRLYRKDRL